MLRLTWKEWLTAHALFPFKVCLAFYDCSFLLWNFSWKGKYFENYFLKFFFIFLFALLPSRYFNFLRWFQIIVFLANFTQMLSLNRYEKVTCEKCGTQTTKPNLARHKKSCSVGTLYCAQCLIFSIKSRNDLNNHIAKKHGTPISDIAFKCTLCYAEFRGFHALRQHKNTQYGPNMGFGASNINVEDIVGDVNDQSLREEL